MFINYATGEIILKIVYYGTGLCGKTTNLKSIHEGAPEAKRGKLLSLATQSDRTLFFDLLPMEIGTLAGMRIRLQLYTVPGQVFYNSTRQMVLKGADAVVFVVDSQRPLFAANIESYKNLQENLRELGMPFEEMPMVVQYNKRDLGNVVPVAELEAEFNTRGAPSFSASASKGVGVLESLKEITRQVLRRLPFAVDEERKGKEEARPGQAAEARGRLQPAAPVRATSAWGEGDSIEGSDPLGIFGDLDHEVDSATPQEPEEGLVEEEPLGALVMEGAEPGAGVEMEENTPPEAFPAFPAEPEDEAPEVVPEPAVTEPEPVMDFQLADMETERPEEEEDDSARSALARFVQDLAQNDIRPPEEPYDTTEVDVEGAEGESVYAWEEAPSEREEEEAEPTEPDGIVAGPQEVLAGDMEMEAPAVVPVPTGEEPPLDEVGQDSSEPEPPSPAAAGAWEELDAEAEDVAAFDMQEARTAEEASPEPPQSGQNVEGEEELTIEAPPETPVEPETEIEPTPEPTEEGDLELAIDSEPETPVALPPELPETLEPEVELHRPTLEVVRPPFLMEETPATTVKLPEPEVPPAPWPAGEIRLTFDGPIYRDSRFSVHGACTLPPELQEQPLSFALLSDPERIALIASPLQKAPPGKLRAAFPLSATTEGWHRLQALALSEGRFLARVGCELFVFSKHHTGEPYVTYAEPQPAQVDTRFPIHAHDLVLSLMSDRAGDEYRLSYLVYRRRDDSVMVTRPLNLPMSVSSACRRALASIATSDPARFERQLVAAGDSLFRLLIPPELRELLSSEAQDLDSLLVVSEDTWIPWEILRPSTDAPPLGTRLRIGQWPGPMVPRGSIGRRDGLGILESAEDAPCVLVPEDATVCHGRDTALFSLTGRPLDLIYLRGHGALDPDLPAFTSLDLTDGQLQAADFATLQSEMQEGRPWFLLDALADERPADSGAAAWATTLLLRLGAGGLIAPRLSLSPESSREGWGRLQRLLLGGMTVGSAMREVRRYATTEPGADLAISTFALFGDPEARLT